MHTHNKLNFTIFSFKKSVILFSAIFSFFLTSDIFSEEIHKFDHDVTGLINYNSNHLLFLGADGQTNWMDLNTLQFQTKHYTITDPACFPVSQNPMSMDGSRAGMILSYPFLVGMGWICKIDDAKNTIDFVNNFILPENFYTISYAGENENFLYFLMNSKPIKGTGFLHLVTIDKNNFAVSTTELMKNVPGYSGAMFYNNGDLWISTWPVNIYKISKENLAESVSKKTSVNFTDVAAKSLNSGMEMSLFMLANEDSLLLYNDNYKSYTVDLKANTLNPISPRCLPISGFGHKWLTLCEHRSLQTWATQAF